VGGVGEFAAALHAGLLRRGVESRVLTRGRSGDRAPGLHRIASSRLGWFLFGLAEVPGAARADVVHFHTGEALPALLALRLWPGRRARLLVTFHVGTAGMQAAERPYRLAGHRFGPGVAERLRGSLLGLAHRAVEALAQRLADAMSFVSRATAIDVLGPARGASARVIYNGVVTGDGSAGPAASTVELFYAGLPTHRKRVLALPFALRAVRREIPAARLRLAGFRLEDAPALRRLLSEQGLESHVECIGRVASSELAAFYRAAKVVVVPSAYEGLPYVILEAMRFGAPVVATRVSGNPEAIEDGATGFLVPTDDPEALAARCVQILRDPALARRLAAAARDRLAQRFDQDRQIDEYLEYYRALAREAP
jgi:glycosyltransferase involved in cell wall biosynthesis